MKAFELILNSPAEEQDGAPATASSPAVTGSAKAALANLASPPTTEDDELVLSARQRIVLRCGRSSLTMYANGKIVLRGEYILSEAEDLNRLAGGRIELN